MTTFDPFDDRTDDDLPPAASTVTQVCLGSRWKVDSTSDGTILLTDRKTRAQIDIGFDSYAALLEFLVDAALAAGAWSAVEEHARKTRPSFDVFELFHASQRDAETLAS